MDTCPSCAAERDPRDPGALAWMRDVAPDGAVSWTCPRCARRHVRDIEAKLGREWWTLDHGAPWPPDAAPIATL